MGSPNKNDTPKALYNPLGRIAVYSWWRWRERLVLFEANWAVKGILIKAIICEIMKSCGCIQRSYHEFQVLILKWQNAWRYSAPIAMRRTTHATMRRAIAEQVV